MKLKIFPTLHFFIKDRLIYSALLLSFLLNIAAWLFLFFQIKPKPTPFFLHYTVYFGVDWTGEWYKLFLLPAAGFLILIVNFVLGYFVYKSQKLLSYFLVLSSVFLEILVLVQSVMLVMMNS